MQFLPEVVVAYYSQVLLMDLLFCGSCEERCFCLLSSAPILADAGKDMDVDLRVPVGKDSWVWLEIVTSFKVCL